MDQKGYVNILGESGYSQPWDPTRIFDVRLVGETDGLVQFVPAGEGTYTLGFVRGLNYSYRYRTKYCVQECTVVIPADRGESFEEEISRALKEREEPDWQPIGA